MFAAHRTAWNHQIHASPKRSFRVQVVGALAAMALSQTAEYRTADIKRDSSGKILNVIREIAARRIHRSPRSRARIFFGPCWPAFRASCGKTQLLPRAMLVLPAPARQ